MAVTYSSTLKNNRMQLVADLIAGKTAAASTGTAASGFLVIGTSALDGSVSSTTGVLAKITLNATPGTVGSGVLTISGVPLSALASASGNAAKAEIWTSANSPIVTGLTVAASPGPGDVLVSSIAITSGQTVQVTSATITHG